MLMMMLMMMMTVAVNYIRFRIFTIFWRSLQRSPDLLTIDLRGLLLRGGEERRKGEDKEGKGGKGREEEGPPPCVGMGPCMVNPAPSSIKVRKG